MPLPEEWYNDPTTSLAEIVAEYTRLNEELLQVSLELEELENTKLFDSSSRRGFVKVWVVYHEKLDGSAINPFYSWSVDRESFIAESCKVEPEIKMIETSAQLYLLEKIQTRSVAPEDVEEYDASLIDPVIQKMFDDTKHLRDLLRKKEQLWRVCPYFKSMFRHWCRISGHECRELTKSLTPHGDF